MFRFVRTRLIRNMAILKGALAVKKKEDQNVNPWEADLARLASERKLDETPVVKAAEPDEISMLVQELAKAAKTDFPAVSQPPEPPKARRAGDGTVTDLKSWWGDSVATWDPEVDGKNVNSADQRNKARSQKWFDKGGPTFDK